MQRVGKIICCSLLILFMSNILLAQKIEFPEGFYVNQKGQKIVGFFDLEGFRDNIITIRTSQDEKIGQPLVVDDVEKIVLEKGNKDSTVFLTQKLTYKGEEETIYLECLLRGGINFLRGFSKNEREVFYISSTALPTLRRINKSKSLQRAVNKVLSYGFGFKYTLSKENIGLSVWTSENTNYFPLAHRLDLFGHLLFTIK